MNLQKSSEFNIERESHGIGERVPRFSKGETCIKAIARKPESHAERGIMNFSCLIVIVTSPQSKVTRVPIFGTKVQHHLIQFVLKRSRPASTASVGTNLPGASFV